MTVAGTSRGQRLLHLRRSRRPRGGRRQEELPGRFNYFRGNEPSKWRTGVRGYRLIRYHDLYPGVDVEVKEGDLGRLEYDLILEPGANLDQVSVRCAGADSLSLDENSALIVRTSAGVLVQEKLHTFEIDNCGERRPVECSFRVVSRDRFGFEALERDRNTTLLIDPGLVYSTFLGGSSRDEADGITLDGTGAAYVTGSTLSPDFPTTPGAFDTTLSSDYDAFVTKLNASGSALVYSTYLGGSSADYAHGIAVDSALAAYVTGGTFSTDFPTTSGAFDTTQPGTWDAFVTKLDASGSAVVYSTYVGGSDYDSSTGVAVDGAGAAYVAGSTHSANFPTTPGAFDTTCACGYKDEDAFVTKLNASGSGLVYSTFLGGVDEDGASGIAVDSAGAAYVTGSTNSTDFPTTAGAFDTTYNGGFADAFVTKLDASGSALIYSTFLGGSNTGGPGGDGASGIAVDGTGNAYVTGATDSSDFPTTPGAFDTTFNGFAGNPDAYVTKLNTVGTELVYSTFLGGSSPDWSNGIAVDSAGAVYVTGDTYSTDLPTTPGAFATTFNDVYDAFVTRVNTSGKALLYSTFLGGSHEDSASAIATDSAGAAYVTGSTFSTDFPTTPGAFDTSYDGLTDALVTKLIPSCSTDAAWGNYGSGWPGTNGVPPFTSSGDPAFCTTVTLNIANSLGATTQAALILGLAQADIPTAFGGHLLVLPMRTIVLSLPGAGLALQALISCDGMLCGLSIYLQTLEVDAGASRGVSFTPGLELVLGS
ncbi:MAG: SBBP repeat-containing protein [Planctomycetota bacterium]